MILVEGFEIAEGFLRFPLRIVSLRPPEQDVVGKDRNCGLRSGELGDSPVVVLRIEALLALKEKALGRIVWGGKGRRDLEKDQEDDGKGERGEHAATGYLHHRC